MGSDALGRWCDRNRDNFYKMLKYQNLFRDYSIEFTESDDFDYMFVGMSDFINKQIPLKDSVERGLQNLEKITGGGDYFLFDGSDSTSLMGAYEVLEQGGNTACALNAANEITVDAFLNNKIGFLDIAHLNEEAVIKNSFIKVPSYEDLVETDRETRVKILEKIG